ncbi:MAG TPA: hypothetical protein VEK07_07510 [Polyangiaceae bacterium]|nr:hypothetical protein [Polyangiaceae bacterium]
MWRVSGWFLAIGGCNPRGTPGAACLSAPDCQAGLSCLYPIGAGCDAQGACDVPPNGCLPGASRLVLCGCADATVDLSCIGDNATLPQPTATGSICGGREAGDE